MSRNRKNQTIDLKLNLSPPAMALQETESPTNRSISPTSSASSCISSEADSCQYSSSPESLSMVLAGCPRCLMYVMLSAKDQKCPKCKSSVLLDIQQGIAGKTKN